MTRHGIPMILRRYGSAYHSVDPAFEPAALTEIGFRRNHAYSFAAAEFDRTYVEVAVRDLSAKAEGEVQRQAEAELLAGLKEALAEEAAGLADGQALVVLNGRGDWPKTRERREVAAGGGDNSFRFRCWVEPALRVGVFARRGD